jgi:hypothetical protein
MFECETCKGTGIRYLPAPGSDPDDCPDCDGKGYLIPDDLVDLAADEWRDRTNSAGANLAAARYTLAAVFDWLGFGDTETIRWCVEHRRSATEGMKTCDKWRTLDTCRIVGRLLLPPRGAD